MSGFKSMMTPFTKQCFVVVGASINMSQIGMVLGYTSTLLPQLRAQGSDIPIDMSLASWIAAVPAFGLVVGNLIIPLLMGKLGRRKANLISVAIAISGWVCFVAAQNIIWILIARLLHGLSIGLSFSLTPILIGEYTSPRNRGAFIIIMSLIMAGGTFAVHTLGSYLTWKITALVITIITLIDLIMVALSPETPSWLADQGKYEECKRVFQWLRDEEETKEMQRLIQASDISRQSKNVSSSMSFRIKGYISTVKKKEFYKPIIIMIHLYTMGQWAGFNIFASYIVNIVHLTIGTDIDMPFMIKSMDVLRIISCVIAVLIIKRFKRRTMLFTTCGVIVLAFLISAGYVYAKSKYTLSFENSAIGWLLLYTLMTTVAIGSMPLSFTIAGEIFALKYRSLSTGISTLFYSFNLIFAVKSFPYLVTNIGLHGAYCVYSGIMLYCLIVVWFLLPETKDRTLQEIEDEFKGKVADEDLNAAEPLTDLRES